MSNVFLLWHVTDPADANTSKLCGVFSSEATAKDAIALLSRQPGFCDHPNGFEICDYRVDELCWSEGFVPWPDGDLTEP